MDIDVRAKLTNSQSVTPNDSSLEAVRIEIAVLADQDYERIQKLNNPNCEDYRLGATKLIATVIPLDGSWSDEFMHDVAFKHSKVSTQGRPRMYYFQVLDCQRELSKVFKTGQLPKIATEVHMTTG
mmetsp:Transcript_1228/g.1617  ORF Transcript_1228/g.1617 Transcript_1228/m.1617 type:complete len:126 (-) Transcript_1228:867-1244(-)|eukprot:CAMPEP_0170464850 /NCGR_PEP_ID=MMETSP0123-20130129/9408_1 /TAXON_ID=182087 /ORGANISM="Favella ehrenbergii, Strain Fehren 1" /LENGTH=125 /DNA_ID=CAMNT_0010730587 /DNA_START=197 /DNA_END=574 /DNA_ORIENTATION=-